MQAAKNAFVIAYESFCYRVRKHELNNLLATFSMLVVFYLPNLDVVLRLVFAVLLNFFIYLSNDYCDLEVDLEDEQKNQSKTRFMAEHRGAARGAVISELAALAVVAAAHAVVFQSFLLPLALVLNVALYHGYSRWLKRLPIVDLLAMTLAGATSTMVGAPSGALGLQLLGVLALFSGSYELIQVIRDFESDTRLGVRTTAVLLGPRAAAWVFRAMVLAAALVGVLLVGSRSAAAISLAACLPLRVNQAAHSWDKARLIFGLSWLALLVEISLGR